MRPRIGITTSTLERTPEGALRTSAATHLVYAQCIYDAGGLPLLLPNLPAADAAEVLASLDGLLLSGGGDIDPAFWGEAPHPALGSVDPGRDHFEYALVRAAQQRGLPVLGICRGIQMLAVAAGGTIWQDIPAQLPDSLPHQQTAPRHQPSHRVTLAPGSRLARILLPAPADSAAPLHIDVNSFHHQAARSCATIFSAMAWSDDGLIEGIAAADDWFALGVQWHPEEMAATDPRQARLFTALIEAARG